ncbi:MAG: NADPH-dependent FMN reductase [Mycobacteriales bacterium]
MPLHPTGVRILGISGSLRVGSINTQLLHAAVAAAPVGVEISAWDGLRGIPPFNEDDEADPGPDVMQLRTLLDDADGLLIATPEYNGSLPGQLKNAIDWASRPYGAGALTGKPVAVIGASPAPSGTSGAQASAHTALGAAGAAVAETSLAIPNAAADFSTATVLQNAELRSGLTAALEGLLALIATRTARVAPVSGV